MPWFTILRCGTKSYPQKRSNWNINYFCGIHICYFVSTGSTTGSTALYKIGKTLLCLQIGAICGLCTGPFFGSNGSNSEPLCLNHTVVMIPTSTHGRHPHPFVVVTGFKIKASVCGTYHKHIHAQDGWSLCPKTKPPAMNWYQVKLIQAPTIGP